MSEMIKVIDVKPYDKNAKAHPKSQIDAVAKSIKEFGFNQPIVIDNDNVLIVGHGRLEAAKVLGMVEVPFIKKENLTKDQVNAYRLADNKLNESDWDMALVVEELKDMDVELAELTGFDLDLVIEPEENDDEVPELPEEPTAQLGDIYQLGDHRILCGDSTKIEDVERLMDGKKADMVFTDPPYGMKKEKDGVLNDNLNFDNLLEFNKEWIPLTIAYLSHKGSWYCWGIDEPLMDIYSFIMRPYIKENKMNFRNLITWDKGQGQGQNSENTKSYATADEKCLFLAMGIIGTVINAQDYEGEWDSVLSILNTEMEQSKLSEDEIKSIVGKEMYPHYFTTSQFCLISEKKYKELGFTTPYIEIKNNYEEAKEFKISNQLYFNNTHDNMNNVWHFSRTKNDERKSTGGHATPKPIELCSRALKSSSEAGGLILDVFLGSGSTLIAAQKTGRICYGIELDPKYIDVIVKRWEDYTGETAIKIS